MIVIRMQIWKEFLILNCIEKINISLKVLKSSTLNACWKKLWPDVVIRANPPTPSETDVNCLITAEQNISREGFVNMNKTDITKLINFNKDIDEIELIELANCSHSRTEEENSVQILNMPKKPLSLEDITNNK